jgi:hypothetical protein
MTSGGESLRLRIIASRWETGVPLERPGRNLFAIAAINPGIDSQ